MLSFKHSFAVNDLELLLSNPKFLESIYIASPVLYKECIKYKANELTSDKEKQKLINAIAKYYTRMYSRCTPFGLFSTCSLAEWSTDNTSFTFMEEEYNRHTRLDMYYLCSLAKQLAALPFIKQQLLFYTNNTCYIVDNEVRYIEYKYQKVLRKYVISSVTHSTHLNKILDHCNNGAKLDTIKELLIKDNVNEETAINYVNSLIDAQILVDELEPAITGAEFLYQIINVLQRINEDVGDHRITAIIEYLQQINNEIDLLDQRKVNKVEHYKKIIDTIQKLNIPFEENKLFQIDAFRKPENKSKINANIQDKLLSALDAITRITFNPQQENASLLQQFANKFYEKYEERSIPILEALDFDYGIGYPVNKKKSFAPLVNDILPTANSSNENKMLKLEKSDKWPLNIIAEAYTNQQYMVELTEDMLPKEHPSFDDMPPSLSAMFKIIDQNTDQILIDGFFGSSAINILGRFAHAHVGINELANQIAKEEEEKNSETIFAEIIHLPDTRAGNVILHPSFRAYEIPYLGKPTVTANFQISLKDVYIKLTPQKHIILYSPKHNKVIIPRLSNMHNYVHASLPIYHFLSDLQHQQSSSSFVFNWGIAKYLYAFFPRLIYKNIILSAATWRLNKKDLKELDNLNENNFNEIIKTFTHKRKLPRLVLFIEADNELLIDFENNITVTYWLTIAKRYNENIFLKECIHNATNTDFTFINQCIAPIIKNTPTYTTQKFSTNILKEIQANNSKRTFTIGEEWLYFKIYCGESTADNVLTENISPAITELLSNGHIQKWFFIRYADPDFHLRIRFKLSKNEYCANIIQTINSYLKAKVNSNIVYKIQLDTYKRELERYGDNTIDLSESIFYFDSQACLQLINLLNGDEKENIKWLWALRAIDELLNNFGLTLQEKHTLMKLSRDAFNKEMKIDKAIKEKINAKHRTYKAAINEILNNNIYDTNKYKSIIDIIDQRSKSIQSIAEEIISIKEGKNLMVNWTQLLCSYIHMTCNRLITSKARVYEMVIYDFMYKYYELQKATQYTLA